MRSQGLISAVSAANSLDRFDSSSERGDLVTQIGIGNLIRGMCGSFRRVGMADVMDPCKGWDEAVLEMKVGERAILDITR